MRDKVNICVPLTTSHLEEYFLGAVLLSFTSLSMEFHTLEKLKLKRGRRLVCKSCEPSKFQNDTFPHVCLEVTMKLTRK